MEDMIDNDWFLFSKEEFIEIDWDLFSKEEFIEYVKFAYQNPGAIIFHNYEEVYFDYDNTDWKGLFSRYDSKDWIRKEDEMLIYKGLPEILTVYRGGISDNGISWTLDKRVAEWFASDSQQYEGKDTKVFEKTIKKSDIRALILDMGEKEVILI